MMPKMAIPGVGYLVYCQDTEGNLFGTHQEGLIGKMESGLRRVKDAVPGGSGLRCWLDPAGLKRLRGSHFSVACFFAKSSAAELMQ